MTRFRLSTGADRRQVVDLFRDGLLIATIRASISEDCIEVISYRITRRPGAVRFSQAGPDSAAVLTIDLSDTPPPGPAPLFTPPAGPMLQEPEP